MAKLTRISRGTLVVIYDLMHFFVLHGPELPRDRVIGYLSRCSGLGYRLGSRDRQAMLRKWERYKVALRRIGVGVSWRMEAGSALGEGPGGGGKVCFIRIESAHEHRDRLCRLIDRLVAARQATYMPEEEA